jgi:hypothetical protein
MIGPEKWRRRSLAVAPAKLFQGADQVLRRAELPSQEFVWTVLMGRIEEHFHKQKRTILQFCGLYDVFGPPGVGFTGEQEGDETIIELTGLILVSFAQDLEERCESARFEKKAGRPCDVLTREVGPKLLDLFLRYHPSAGRHSVWTVSDRAVIMESTGASRRSRRVS